MDTGKLAEHSKSRSVTHPHQARKLLVFTSSLLFAVMIGACASGSSQEPEPTFQPPTLEDILNVDYVNERINDAVRLWPEDAGFDGFIASPESRIRFGTADSLFPEPVCDGEAAQFTSGLVDSSSWEKSLGTLGSWTNSNAKAGPARIIQQAGRLGSEEDVAALLEIVRSNASGNTCNVSNDLYSDFIWENEPLLSLPTGLSGYTWSSEFYQIPNETCSPYEALVVRKKFWLVTEGNTFVVTLAQWPGCEDSYRIVSTAEWEDVLQAGLLAHNEVARKLRFG